MTGDNSFSAKSESFISKNPDKLDFGKWLALNIVQQIAWNDLSDKNQYKSTKKPENSKG